MHLLSFLFFASVRRRCAAPLHRNRTSPPSLWPGRELRKYHCPQHLSSPPPGAARLLSCKLYRSLISEVVAHSRKRLRGSAHSVGNVPDACMFGFQGSLSGKALRKQICLASCGENPLTIRWVMLSDFWTFLFSLSPFNGHFSARCQVSHRIYFCCGRQRGGRAEALSSHLSMDIFLRNLNHREKYIFDAAARGTTAAQAV